MMFFISERTAAVGAQRPLPLDARNNYAPHSIFLVPVRGAEKCFIVKYVAY